MKLVTANDDVSGALFHRKISENNLVEMGVFRVMFGWRIRAGFCGKYVYELDWCGGGDWKNVERLYSICYAILSNREENRQCFDGLPMVSKIKPFFMDLEFLDIVTKEAGDISLISLDPTKQIVFGTS